MESIATSPFYIIPPIVNPLGRYWDQPDRENITIDEKSAIMSQADFEKLHDYSTSDPTGCYEGKMWKSYATTNHTWYLSWYDYHTDIAKIRVCSREIIIL